MIICCLENCLFKVGLVCLTVSFVMSFMWFPAELVYAQVGEAGSRKGNSNFLLAREGKGFLEEIDGQLVLHLKGAPYEMGYQHGKMLAEKAKENLRAYLYETAFEKQGHTLEELLGVFEKARPYIPQSFLDEMKGLSDGSGIELDEIQAMHILPTLHHCSGAAVMNDATVDGKLYHYRSLDFPLDFGNTKTVQDSACVIVYEPDGMIPHVAIAWAGTIGCVTGMNAKAISFGEMGSSSSDETHAGLPMWFQLREVLQKAATLDKAIQMMKDWKRTCGFNFIITDGKIPDAVAVEVTHSRIAFFHPNDPAENVPPHWPMKNVVRRVNHFVSPEIAATQRQPYDPSSGSDSASWLGYKLISEFIERNYGKFDSQKMIELCRQYPPTHSCLHQAVFCPIDQDFWVANAVNPRSTTFPGAQNQKFYHYNLKELLAKDPNRIPLKRKIAKRGAEQKRPKPGAPAVTKGTYKTHPLSLAEVKGDKTRELLRFYDNPDEADEFDWKLVESGQLLTQTAYDLSLPSPVKTGVASNDVIHARYFVPNRAAKGGGRKGLSGGTGQTRPSEGKLPGVVVLHHLENNLLLEEMICRKLASDGIAALLMSMPYYGKRRPADGRVPDLLSEDLGVSRRLVRQAVLDARRCASWLAQRPEVDENRVGILGISLGAIIGSLTAGVDGEFSRCAFILGGGDIAAVVFNESRETAKTREALTQRGITADKLRSEWQKIDPLTFASRIDPKSVLMVNASKDEIIPRQCTERLWAAMGKPQIEWYDAGHVTISMYIFEILDKVSKHFLGKR